MQIRYLWHNVDKNKQEVLLSQPLRGWKDLNKEMVENHTIWVHKLYLLIETLST